MVYFNLTDERHLYSYKSVKKPDTWSLYNCCRKHGYTGYIRHLGAKTDANVGEWAITKKY